MKSASSITLAKAWWKKEAPDGLKKSGAAFEKALDDYARAEGALNGARADAAAKAFEKALEALLAAAKQVAAEAKDLEKKAKDKKAKADLANTVAVMGKPLAKEVAAARARIAALGAEEEEEDGAFGTAAAHAAFLKKWAPRIKRGQVSFAVGLPSNKPEEMRFNFHLTKDGRGLANALKKEAGAKKFTFGRAGTEGLAEAHGEEDVGARTLCLHLEGRRIPGLAKRVKLMLKTLGVSQFGRVKILEGGVEIEGADETTADDAALEAVDLEAPDEAEETAASPTETETEPEPTPAPAVAAAPPPPPPPSRPEEAAAPARPARAGWMVALLAEYRELSAEATALMASLRPEQQARLKALMKAVATAIPKGDQAEAEARRGELRAALRPGRVRLDGGQDALEGGAGDDTPGAGAAAAEGRARIEEAYPRVVRAILSRHDDPRLARRLEAFRVKLERAAENGGRAAVDALLRRLAEAATSGAEAVRAFLSAELAGPVADIVDLTAPENFGADGLADLLSDPASAGRLEYFVQAQAMAETPGLIGATEHGGARIAAALKGESYLGALSEEEKSYLARRAIRLWVYSPLAEEDGAGENLDALTAAFKGDGEAADWLSSTYMSAAQAVYDSQGEMGGEAGRFGSTEVRNLHTELWREAAAVSPRHFADEGFALLGPARAGQFVTGAMRKDIGPRSSAYDRRNPYFKSLEAGDRLALVDAAAAEGVTPERTLPFLKEVFAATTEDEIETAARQATWARALARIVPAGEGREIDRAALEAEMSRSLATEGGRQLLFGAAIPAPLRSWALTQMAPPPDGQGWTADDLAAGWESEKVGEAFGAEAMAAARRTPPMTFDPVAEKPAMHNAIGQALGIPPNNLPGEGESDTDRAARLAAGFDHPYYSDTADGPIQLIQGHLAELGGTPVITPIPITYTSNENGASIFKVLRIESENGLIFVDHKGNRFTDAPHWERANELPPGRLTYPEGLALGGAPKHRNSPDRDDWVWDALDLAAMAAGTVAGIVIIAGSGGTAAPLVVGLAAAYSTGRGAAKLADRAGKGHNIADVTDPTTRGLLLETASGLLAVSAIGGGMRAARLLQQGSKMSRTGANIVSGLTVAGSVADAAAMTDGIAQLSLNWDRMTPEQKATALLQLSFQAGMGAASAKAGGGRFSDGFNFARTRNQLEFGTPYTVRKAPDDMDLAPGQVAVRYEGDPPSKFEIVYQGDEMPSREMLELHSRAASGMEASITLEGRITAMLTGAETQPKPGTAAWEAYHELRKIRDEKTGLLEVLNAGPIDADQAASIRSRLDELNGSLIDEAQRLSDAAADPRGFVANPSPNFKKAQEQGLPYRTQAMIDADPSGPAPGEVPMPEGYRWRTHPDTGDLVPEPISRTSPPLRYDAATQSFEVDAAALARALRHGAADTATMQRTKAALDAGAGDAEIVDRATKNLLRGVDGHNTDPDFVASAGQVLDGLEAVVRREVDQVAGTLATGSASGKKYKGNTFPDPDNPGGFLDQNQFRARYRELRRSRATLEDFRAKLREMEAGGTLSAAEQTRLAGLRERAENMLLRIYDVPDGHGPANHVRPTPETLGQRAILGRSPIDGKGGDRSLRASKFSSPEDFFRAKDHLESATDLMPVGPSSTADTTAPRRSLADMIADAEATNTAAVTVFARLETVYGANYRAHVEGVSFSGSSTKRTQAAAQFDAGNTAGAQAILDGPPKLGVAPTNFQDGFVRATYVRVDDRWELVTMFPVIDPQVVTSRPATPTALIDVTTTPPRFTDPAGAAVPPNTR